MTEAELEAFARKLSPAHETVVLLREIRDLLKPFYDAEVLRAAQEADTIKRNDATLATLSQKGKKPK